MQKILLNVPLYIFFSMCIAGLQAQTQQLKKGDIPKGIDADSWASIQKQIEMSKYKAYPNKKGGYNTANLAHGLQIAYGKDGSTKLTPRNHCEADYRISLRLKGIGYKQIQTLALPKSLRKEDSGKTLGSKVSYTWSKDLTEWWINNEKGLEQWFSIRKAPQGRDANTPLRLRLALATDMQVSLQHNRLTLTKNNTTLTYDKLKVWDAKGREIKAEMAYTAGELELLINDASATYPLTIDPTFTQQAYLKASNTEAVDNFGRSVAISGETIVVGAWLEDSNATGVNGNEADNSASSAGAAYVFVRNGTTWTQQAYLKASNTETADNFGISVAISGETIVVGAYNESSNATGVNGNEADNSATEAGAAYVFVRNGTTWVQQAYLKASNAEERDRFGYSVAISGETIVVGAYQERSNATGSNGDGTDNSVVNAGAAYVFVRSGTTWTQQVYLKASNTGASDRFGYSVAISGETIIIGAYSESSNATGVNGNQMDNNEIGAGAAYVFARSGGVWSQQAYLKASNTGSVDRFGWSVAISGEMIVVGAFREDSNATGVNGAQTDDSANDAGAVYVFAALIPQTITFDTLPAKTFGDAPFDLTATASSGLPVSYSSSNTAVATISGNTITIVGAGTTAINASQAGNINYSAAPDVTQDLVINRANQSITFECPPTVFTFNSTNNQLVLGSATSSSGLPVTFSITTLPSNGVATINGNIITVQATGTINLKASVESNTNYNPATLDCSTIEVSLPTSLQGESLAELIQVSPNPSKHIFVARIHSLQLRGLSYQIRDALGLLLEEGDFVKQSQYQEAILDLSKQSAGLYLLEIVDERGQSIVKSLIKQ